MKKTIQPGECINTVAREHGFLPKSLWELPDNDSIREQRKDPNCLMPGDVVEVPERRPRDERVPTDSVGTFQLQVPPLRLRVKMTRRGEPRSGVDYELSYDSGESFSGTTDGDGFVDQLLPNGAKQATLTLEVKDEKDEKDEPDEQYVLEIGHLHPADEPTGIQARLTNLGYYFHAIDGAMGVHTQAALRRFQKAQGLDPTGEIDPDTVDTLRAQHGS